MSEYNDITKYVPLRRAVNMAAMDTHKDIGLVERQYFHWAARGLDKLTEETIRTGKRYAILTVNQHSNTARLDCDFKEDLFVGYIDSCGEKVPLTMNPNLVNAKFIDTIPCELECEAKCDCCYPKQLCQDLTTTQEIKKIDINGTEYDQTITSTLLPSGEYYIEKSTPYYNTITDDIDYKPSKEYITKFDVEDCGCIKTTAQNASLLQTHCYDAYCCYCTSCSKECGYKGGYKIFTENGIIQFDRGMKLDKVYMEWRGSIPKVDGEYVIPEIALETLASWIVFKEGQYNKSLPLYERKWREEQYEKNRGNMEKTMGRMKLSTIVHAMLFTPKVSYHSA